MMTTEDWLAAEPALRDAFPWEPRYTEVAGARVAHVESGTGRPLLMLHGNPTWSFVYRGLIARLDGQFRCLAPDYPGFGRSIPPPNYGYTPAEHARVIEAWLLERDLRDIVLVVQDWGGPIGLWLAARHPERFSGLAIGNTWAWPVNGDWHFEWFSRLFGGALGRWAILRHNAFVELLVPAGIRRRKVAPAVMNAYRLPFRAPAARIATHVFPREILGSRDFLSDVERGLPTLRHLPAVLLWGDRDVAFRAKELKRFQREFPEARVVPLPGAGHFVQEDAPEEIAQAVSTAFASQLNAGHDTYRNGLLAANPLSGGE